MNGPPIIAGFFSAATWICGVATNELITFTCEFATYIAAVAGAIRYGHAYQRLISGSAATFGLRYTGAVIARDLRESGSACAACPRPARRAESPRARRPAFPPPG